jgi:hypothetical protein
LFEKPFERHFSKLTLDERDPLDLKSRKEEKRKKLQDITYSS